jgi:hypothetical protein
VALVRRAYGSIEAPAPSPDDARNRSPVIARPESSRAVLDGPTRVRLDARLRNDALLVSVIGHFAWVDDAGREGLPDDDGVAAPSGSLVA